MGSWLGNIPTPPVGGNNRLKRKLVLLAENEDVEVDFGIHGTTQSALVKYFKYLVGVVGCQANMHVSIRAWELVCKALAVASGNEEPQNDGVSNSLKAIVCACVSLAVEVSADFESTFVVSSAAWGHLLFSQVTGRDTLYPTKSDIQSVSKSAADLMRLKLIISAGLGWNLGFQSTADLVARYLFDLTNNCPQTHACDICTALKENSDEIPTHNCAVILALSCALFPKGESSQVIALMAVIVTHETFKSRQPASTYPVNRMRRALKVTRNSVGTNGVNACILEMAGRMLKSAGPLLRARDLLLCDDTAASVLEFADSPYNKRSSFLRDIDSCLQNDETFNNLL